MSNYEREAGTQERETDHTHILIIYEPEPILSDRRGKKGEISPPSVQQQLPGGEAVHIALCHLRTRTMQRRKANGHQKNTFHGAGGRREHDIISWGLHCHQISLFSCRRGSHQRSSTITLDRHSTESEISLTGLLAISPHPNSSSVAWYFMSFCISVKPRKPPRTRQSYY